VNSIFRACGGSFLAVCAASAQTPVAPTTTALDVTANGSAVTTTTQGTVVTLTATVTAAGAPVVPGQVNFCDATATLCSDIHLLGTAQLTTAGTAAIKFVPGPGTHSYKAVFLGTTAKAGSASAASSLTVTAAPLDASTTTIASSGSPGNYALTATVTGKGDLPPSGTISFLDTSNASFVLATAPLSPQAASSGTLDFSNSSNPATDPYPQSVVVADFNGDGKLDLAVPVYSIFTPLPALDVFLGNGDGTFTAAPAVSATGYNANFIAVGDFNGDGKPDIALTLADNASGVLVLLGNGDGTFSPLPNMPIPGVYSIAATDLNGDGILDLVVTAGGSSLDILIGKGDGTFTVASTLTTTDDVVSIATGDFNGDGIPDVAAAIFPYHSGGVFAPGSVEIFLGKGDGTFTPVASEPAVGYSPINIVAGDLNGDGILDLAVANLTSDNVNEQASVTVLLGKGDGTFTPTAQTLLTGNLPYSVAIGDFNGDGIPDLVTANAASNTATVFLGNGDGTFTTGPSPSLGINPIFAAVGDFNGDGLSDIAAVLNYPNFEAPILLAQDSETQTSIATAGGISVAGTGTHLVDASYPGDDNYLPSTSGTVALTASGFSLAAQPTTQTVAAGGAAVYNLTVTPQGGFSQSVALSCSGLDPGTSCSFSPATVQGGSGPSTLTVQTVATQASNDPQPARRNGLIAAAGLLLLFLPLGARRKRRQWLIAVWLFAALATGAASITGCNPSLQQLGGTSSSTQTIQVTGSAPNGSQPVTATVTVDLIVQTKN
jgi:trimeric autotransporter adhesin